MALGNLLKGRLGKRKEPKEHLREIPAAMPLKDKKGQVYRLVTTSILPRDIRLGGAGATVTLTAANGRICKVSIRPDKGGGFSYDFTQDAYQRDIETAIATFLSELEGFFNAGGLVDVKVTSQIEDFENEAGVESEILMRVSEPPSDEKVPETIEEPQQDTPEAAKTEMPRNDPASESAPVPFDFITRARPHFSEVAFFSEDGEQAFTERKKIDRFVDRSEFSALAEWHKHMSPTLGDEMMFVFLGDTTSTTAYAVSLNEKEGAAIMFNRPKMGQICLSWFKSRFARD